MTAIPSLPLVAIASALVEPRRVATVTFPDGAEHAVLEAFVGGELTVTDEPVRVWSRKGLTITSKHRAARGDIVSVWCEL